MDQKINCRFSKINFTIFSDVFFRILCGAAVIFFFYTPTAFAEPNTTAEKTESLPLNPNLKFPTLQTYEAAIKVPAVMIDSNCVRLFAPKTKAKEAEIIFKYLAHAYYELHRIVGRNTDYKIVVYHFPENDPNFMGGTSNCTIWYGYKNLDFENDEEWKKYNVPHVSGYIEEMAHNFVHAAHVQFGWEMVGWSIGAIVTNRVAPNPIHRKHLQDTKKTQIDAFKRYKTNGFIFPNDIPANLCDRIHAYILWRCEGKYGSNFWPDFFKEINKEYDRLSAAAALSDDNRIRNERYKITIECFDRLEGINFSELLKEYRISLTTDVKSLNPEDSGWNRKFM